MQHSILIIIKGGMVVLLCLYMLTVLSWLWKDRHVAIERMLNMIRGKPDKMLSFAPKHSSTFAATHAPFSISFIDGSEMSGEVGVDVVQMGSYYHPATIGCVQKSAGFWDSQSILGLGFPALQANNVLTKSPLLYSLALSKRNTTAMLQMIGSHFDPSSDDDVQYGNRFGDDKFYNVLPRRVFSLLLGPKGGELHLGGYDHRSIAKNGSNSHAPSITYTPVLPDCENGACAYTSYKIEVEAVRVGNKVVFDNNGGKYNMNALLDSGTTCIILPTQKNSQNGYINLFQRFRMAFTERSEGSDGNYNGKRLPSIFFRIGGTEFEVNPEAYLLKTQKKTSSKSDDLDIEDCFISLDDYSNLFVLGDIFLRNLVAVHDLRDLNVPRIGLAVRNRTYVSSGLAVRGFSKRRSLHRGNGRHRRIGSQSVFEDDLCSTCFSAGELVRLDLQKTTQEHYPASHRSRRNLGKKYQQLKRSRKLGRLALGGNKSVGGVSVVLVVELADVQYTALIAVGTPRQQNIAVILDTGSSSLALFVRTRISRLESLSLIGFALLLAVGNMALIKVAQALKRKCSYSNGNEQNARGGDLPTYVSVAAVSESELDIELPQLSLADGGDPGGESLGQGGHLV